MTPFNENEKVFNNRSGIYVIINIVTNKFYIGSASKLNNRKVKHLSDLRNGKHHSSYLQRSYNKHGKEIFIFKVLEYVDNKKNLLNIEQKYLDIYFNTGVTYNICGIAGSSYGRKHSDETKKRISYLQKKKSVVQFDKNNNLISRFDSIADAEKKTNISNGSISLCCSRKNKTAGNYLWMYEEDYLNGIRYNENYLVSKQLKPILQLTKNNEFIKRYNSISDAMRQTGISVSNISICCSQKTKIAGGYVWKFADE